MGYVPSLPGVMTQGETIPEVLAMAEDAARGYVDVLVRPSRGADRNTGRGGRLYRGLAASVGIDVVEKRKEETPTRV